MRLSRRLKPKTARWLSSDVMSKQFGHKYSLKMAPESHHGQKELLRSQLCRPRLAEASQNEMFRNCRAEWMHGHSAEQACLACSPTPR